MFQQVFRKVETWRSPIVLQEFQLNAIYIFWKFAFFLQVKFPKA